MTKRVPLLVSVVVVVAAGALLVPSAAANGFPAPNQVLPSDLTVQVTPVTTMPSVDGPGIVPLTSGPNLASPVAVKNKLYLIDQNDAIYRLNRDDGVQKIFGVDEAPDGLQLDNRQSILNIAPGSKANSLYVMFTSGTAPTTPTPTPLYLLPPPLPGVCCDPVAPIPVDDLYRIGPIPGPVSFFGTTRTEYQVLYEYKLAGDKLKDPRAIAAFETQSGPTQNGGGMLTLPDGRVLFATGDALPEGSDGRAAPQDPNQVVGKLLIVDPDDGSVEVAAQGVRNAQHLEYVDGPGGPAVAFGDIGGVTAEEVNVVALSDLLDASLIENFGWGRNADGNAREGTFYVAPGVPLVLGTEPPVLGFAPSPEPGFIQPSAQYGRNDPNGGVAVTGPVTSTASFSTITAFFGDLASGVGYATTGPLTDVDQSVFRVNLVDEAGSPLDSFQDLASGRADPRFFRFPDGTAGVLIEATGDVYRLTEIASP